MSISMSQLGRKGRLGNQIFQIYSTIGIAEKNNTTASFPAWTYQKFFNEQLPNDGFRDRVYKEKEFNYEEVRQNDVDLDGYFQSFKYFSKDFKLTFKDEILNVWKDHEMFQKETIGIHIRRGDYCGHELYYQLPMTWYISALISIPNWRDKNIIIVSDDLEYCKVHLECLQNVYFPKGFEIDHLAVLSLCDNHIIGNSSFGFFGAWHSKQKNVIHSGKMFRGAYAYKNIIDYYPPNWKLHNEEKINLSDVTFTVPVLYDHMDRKQNVDLSLCILQRDFHTNIILGEQGKEKRFDYMGKYVRYHYFEGMEKFHRTKMLNEMAVMAETELIVNWDADVIIPPMQVYLAAELLRSGVDCVYPYDGRFARMDRMQWFRKLESNLDIGCVGKAPLDHRHIRESVGGAMMWRKESFIDFGMENEFMISYAPEDVERWERMHTLGVNVQRTGGTLFHMNHYKGIDSHNGNPLFPANKAELEKMRKMSKDEMRLYVDNWPWRHKYTESYYHRISEGAVKSALATFAELSAMGYPFYDSSVPFDRWGSVIDIGCGVGEWSLSNPNYIGVDHNIPVKALMIPVENYHDLDLETVPNNHIAPGHKLWDLCLCLEVAEHISEGRADWLIKFLCTLSDNVLFSAAIPNQGGTGHINEQFQTYWAEKFYANGFGAELCYPVKDNPDVEFWYRANMILYKRGATGKVFDFVLPEYYLQISNYLKNK